MKLMENSKITEARLIIKSIEKKKKIIDLKAELLEKDEKNKYYQKQIINLRKENERCQAQMNELCKETEFYQDKFIEFRDQYKCENLYGYDEHDYILLTEEYSTLNGLMSEVESNLMKLENFIIGLGIDPDEILNPDHCHLNPLDKASRHQENLQKIVKRLGIDAKLFSDSDDYAKEILNKLKTRQFDLSKNNVEKI